MKKYLLFFTVASFTLFSCQKERAENIIEFDLDGVHKTYSVVASDIEEDTTGINPAISITLGSSPLDSAPIILIIADEKSGFNGDCPSLGDFYSPVSPHSCADTAHPQCRVFGFAISSPSGFIQSVVDSAAESFCNINSCNGNPPIINGTFRCNIYDNGGFLKHEVRNGKIISVSYQDMF